mgnify:CR=1 FL=1
MITSRRGCDRLDRDLPTTLALHRDRADLVLLALEDDELDRHAVRARILELHFLDLEIEIALVAVKLRELFLVVVELVVLELVRAGEPREEPVLLGLEETGGSAVLPKPKKEDPDDKP